MMNMDIDSSNCNNQNYSRIRDQNNNQSNGLLMCSTNLNSTTNAPPNLHLMNSNQTIHQMNLNHLSSHHHLNNQTCTGSAYNVCSSMHNNSSNQPITTHLQHDICSSSDVDSSPSPDAQQYKLSPSQNEQIYKREAIDSDNY